MPLSLTSSLWSHEPCVFSDHGCVFRSWMQDAPSSPSPSHSGCSQRRASRRATRQGPAGKGRAARVTPRAANLRSDLSTKLSEKVRNNISHQKKNYSPKILNSNKITTLKKEMRQKSNIPSRLPAHSNPPSAPPAPPTPQTC